MIKAKVCRKISAFGSLLDKKSMAPFMMYEPTDSPGCTLAVKTAARFGFLVSEAIIKYSHLMFPRELHKVDLLTQLYCIYIILRRISFGQF